MPATTHVVCPHCHTPNRLPADKPAGAARCGHCKEKLFSGRPAELDAAAFRKHLEGSGISLVVDFWAPWCGPCRMMAPAFAEAAARLEPRARLIKVNTEAEQELAGRHGIQSIPTVIIFKGGREVTRRSGALDLAGLLAWVGPHL